MSGPDAHVATRKALIDRLRSTPAQYILKAAPERGRTADQWVSNDRAMLAVMREAADYLEAMGETPPGEVPWMKRMNGDAR